MKKSIFKILCLACSFIFVLTVKKFENLLTFAQYLVLYTRTVKSGCLFCRYKGEYDYVQ